MSEDSKGPLDTITKEAKSVGVEAYRDLVKPAATDAGQTLGKAVRFVLRLPNAILDGANKLADKLRPQVEAIPPERQLPPPATIAAPAVLQWAMLGESPEVAVLREMFEKLLLVSMDRETASSAHPAFVSMISQMTPDEAWLLKSITNPHVPQAVIEMRYHQPQFAGVWFPVGLLTNVGMGIGIDEDRVPLYLANLERLGVLVIDVSIGLSNGGVEKEYELLEQRMRSICPAREGHELYAGHGSLKLTPLGVQFISTCVKA